MNHQHIVILHIPKTAGTSLRRIVRNNYDDNECFYAYSVSSGYKTQDDLKKLTTDEKQNYRVFMGHLPFHPQLFPPQNTIYLTMMRDPVNRVLSYYHHVMTLNDKWNRNHVSLLKYLEISDDRQLDNLQTRVLSGMAGPKVLEEHFNKALNNVDNHFAYIGLVEKYPESISTIATMLGWENAEIPMENVSTGRPGLDYYSDYEIQRINDLNEYDYRLYEHVKKRFLHFTVGQELRSRAST